MRGVYLTGWAATIALLTAASAAAQPVDVYDIDTGMVQTRQGVTVASGSTLPLGAPCLDAQQCGSGSCVDGVCCNALCNAGDCDSCVVRGGASSDGVCTRVTGTGCDDGEPCSGEDACQAGDRLAPMDPESEQDGGCGVNCRSSGPALGTSALLAAAFAALALARRRRAR